MDLTPTLLMRNIVSILIEIIMYVMISGNIYLACTW